MLFQSNNLHGVFLLTGAVNDVGRYPAGNLEGDFLSGPLFIGVRVISATAEGAGKLAFETDPAR